MASLSCCMDLHSTVGCFDIMAVLQQQWLGGWLGVCGFVCVICRGEG